VSHPLAPWDEHNQELWGQVHPPDWTNPTPAPRYDLVVIGAGTAGLVTAMGSAGLGAKVALVERHMMGGDCLNFGCVPSKALLRSAHAAADVRDAHAVGVRVPGLEEGGLPPVDFGAVMERMRRLRAGISHHDSAARFSDAGIDVFLGDATFSGKDTVSVAGATLRFRKAVIATGARAFVPPIPGLADAGFLTNETVFSLTELPRRLAVIGGGVIGCELAQAFARFGAEVTLVELADRVLPREDPDASALVDAALREDGVTMRLGWTLDAVEGSGGASRLSISAGEDTEVIDADAILVAVGRSPNVEGLGLEAAGVAYDRKGLTVDDHLRTTNRRIFGAGDVAQRFQFTHAADHTARIAIRNALFFGRARLSALNVPWVTFTHPEVAHVGLTLTEIAERGIETRTFTEQLASNDRAILDGTTDGFARVHIAANSDRILGATVVGPGAGDLVSELSVAMAGGLGLGALGDVIHPYPTKAEVFARLGGQYNRTRLTPFVASLMKRFLAFGR